MEFSNRDLDIIEQRAEEGYTIKAIALLFDVDIALFRVWCLDPNEPVGKAFQKGNSQRNHTLNSKTEKQAKKGSLTAIQILNNQAKLQAFKDLKEDMYSDLDFDFG